MSAEDEHRERLRREEELRRREEMQRLDEARQRLLDQDRERREAAVRDQERLNAERREGLLKQQKKDLAERLRLMEEEKKRAAGPIRRGAGRSYRKISGTTDPTTQNGWWEPAKPIESEPGRFADISDKRGEQRWSPSQWNGLPAHLGAAPWLGRYGWLGAGLGSGLLTPRSLCG